MDANLKQEIENSKGCPQNSNRKGLEMSEPLSNRKSYFLTVIILEAYVEGLILADTARTLGRMLGLRGFGSEG